MKFFVPGEDDAETAWERMRQACGALGTRPLSSIIYEDDGTEVVATVGEEGVIAIIFAGEVYCIFEGLEDWTSVPVESVTEMVFFDDD